jgi:signal transduction histidine kinase
MGCLRGEIIDAAGTDTLPLRRTEAPCTKHLRGDSRNRTVPLRRRVLLVSLALAAVAAIVVDAVAARLRDADRARALDRVADSFFTEVVREACIADPRWFLAGPRSGRPSLAERQIPDAEVYVARPSTDPLPFEFFAYDEQFVGSSTAAPKLPQEFVRVLRASPPDRQISAPFDTPEGRGHQTARLTGWSPGPCAVLLFRQRPDPDHTRWRTLFALGIFAVTLAVALAVAGPVARRIRRLSTSARDAARQDFAAKVAVSGQDEIASLAATFNDTAADVRRRMTDAADREDALQRHSTYTREDVAAPLAETAVGLGALSRDPRLPDAARDHVRRAVRDAYQLSTRLENLAAVAKLRAGQDRLDRARVDIGAVVTAVVADRGALIEAAQVRVTTELPPTPVHAELDRDLFARAVSNVLDNAVMYNQPGGHVAIKLDGYERDARFSLRITDNGPGVSDEAFAGLTANKRFRGDEARTRREGSRGLGLALAREIADRLGLQLDVRRPNAGGLEVEFSVRTNR